MISNKEIDPFFSIIALKPSVKSFVAKTIGAVARRVS